jgi:uncharacterized protein YjdB
MKIFQNGFIRIMCVVLLLGLMAGCSGGGGSVSAGAPPPPATLVSLQVTPTNASIALNMSRQYTATGFYSDNTKKDLTASVTWSSSDTAVAGISNTAGSNGRVTSAAAGTAVIKAAAGAISGSTTLTVTSATLASIEVTPTDPSIARNTAAQFTATGIFSDNTTQDITAYVTWTSSNSAAATVSNAAGSNGLVTAVAAGTADITATLLGKYGISTLTVTSATLSSIAVTPTDPSVAPGTTKRFTATGIFSDDTTQDMTASVTWSSSNAAVATVSNTAGSYGLAAAIAAGSATITATSGTVSGSATLTVTSATLSSIAVTPTDPSIALGTTAQFAATGIFSDNTTQDLTASVTWSSSDDAVVVVSSAAGSNGIATPVAAGSATIKATFLGKTGSTTLTVTSVTLVSIEVNPTDPSIAKGTTKQFTATGIYSDKTTRDLTASVTWSSSDGAVAAISNTAGSNGLATSLAAGSADIAATLGTISGSTTLTVTSATLVTIGVTPASPSIAKGRTVQFTATGIYSDNSTQNLTASVTWSSSDTAVAGISNTAGSKGLATSVGTGSTTITARLGVVSGSATLTVTSAVLQSIDITPSIPAIALGTTQQFMATGTYSDNTTQDLTASVTWSSSNTAVATISNAQGSSGLATSVGAGIATITAALGGVSDSTDLTVGSAALQSIDIGPVDPSIPMGVPQQFSAYGNYSDGSVQDLTAQVTWNTSDPSVATISNAAGSNGLATPVAPGQTTITAALGNIVSAVPVTLTVTPVTLQTITITPATPQIALGTSLQLTATGTYSDSTTQDLTALVTWVSSDGSVATISNAQGTNGLVTSVGAGTTVITASMGSVTNTDTVTLTVTTATLNSITIEPASATIFLGAPQQYTATGKFSDNTTQDLTTQVTWRSSNKTIASISNVPGSNGLATPIRAGSTTISAAFVNAGVTVTGSTGLTVSSAALQSITITPNPASVGVKKTLQFKATGNYGGQLTQDLTTSVNLTWTSSNTAVATIVNVPKKNKGLATGVSAGTTNVKATLRRGAGSGISGQATLTVN